MKKLGLTVLLAGLFFGCSSKQPVVVEQSNLPTELSAVYFDFDKYSIRHDQTGKIVNNTVYLNNGYRQGTYVIIEGNCDEWGSDEYNYALGVKRAASVAKQMVQNGVSPERISLLSFGESAPICTEHTKECWAQNRRSDIYILPLIR